MTEHEKMIITKYDLLFESRLSKTEASLENLDKDVKELKVDIRFMLKLMIAGFVGILGLMAKGFHWL